MDKVSVIVPTYKRSDHICKCIDSILRQSYKNIEIIIIDDNGKNSDEQIETEKILYEYIKNKKVIYIPNEKNMNGAYSRNVGIKNSTGDFICFLDDDDTFQENKIYEQVKVLKSLNDEWGACYTGHNRIYENGKKFPYTSEKQGDLVYDILALNVDMCSGSTLMVRKSILDKVGGFDINFTRYQDIEFVLRVANNFKIASICKPLVNIYTHSGSNKPKDIYKNIQIKEQFINTFKEIIEELDESKIKNIYFNNYLDICKECIKSKKILLTLKYLLKSKDMKKCLFNIIRDSIRFVNKKL